MRRSLRSWADLLVPWAVVAGVGIAAEWRGYGWGAVRSWAPDLVTGWTLATCGLIARQRRPESRCGVLLAASGLAWFAPNFAASGVAGIDWVVAHTIYLHRGPLIHCCLTYPRCRITRRLDAWVVALVYAISTATLVWASPIATIALALTLVVVAAIEFRRSVGLERRERLRSFQATAYLAGVLALTSAMHLRTAGSTVAALHVYEASLCVLAAGLLVVLLRAPWERVSVTDLVVELGGSRSGTLPGELARALGDPSLQVGYWLPEIGSFVDGEGQLLRLPGPGSRQSSTTIERAGEPLAVLVHDPSILSDPGLVDAVSAAAGLAAANARLQAELRVAVGNVADSRRRLLAAGDEERRRLESGLNRGAQRRLDRLGELLREVREAAGAQTRDHVAGAEDQLAKTRRELHRFARGIHPRELSEHGLAVALDSLARDFPLPVDVTVSALDMPPAIEVCVYFVCSEALANVTKYASASRVRIGVSRRGATIVVDVEDDGVGGADLGRGTGLRGLADRVETLGGTFTLDSPPGQGTTVRAELPSRA